MAGSSCRMQLDTFGSSNKARLAQILHTLQHVHGIKVNFDISHPNIDDTLLECQKTYELHRDQLIKESSFNSYLQNPEYTKSILILEAVKLMLTEIAPKRRRKSKVAEAKVDSTKGRTLPAPSTFADQLSDIASKISIADEEGNAFSNALSAISEKLRFKEPLEDTDKEILSWMRSLPKPVILSKLIKDGVEKFGAMLVDLRKDEIKKFKKIDSQIASKFDQDKQEKNSLGENMKEGKKIDQDNDGDTDFADVMIARMVASGVPKGAAIAKVKNKSYNKENAEEMAEVYDYPSDKDTDNKTDELQRRAKLGPNMMKKHGREYKEKDKYGNMYKIAGPKGKLPENSINEDMDVASVVSMNAPGSDANSHAHHYEYQASMARSELYRNAKYAMSMMKQIDPHGEVQPWIAGALTKAANYLDKIYHYLDYYKKFEPEQLPEQMDGDMELGETSGGVTRQNLMLIMEYSIKLFDMIKPGDKLEGWVAMKLTTASECVSSCKHYLDYVQFEQHGLDDHFKDGRIAKIKESRMHLAEQEDLAKASTILAAKDMSSQVQSVAEDVAKMSVEDLMPLVDIMRGQFGSDAATAFNDVVKEALDALLDQATKTKEIMDEATDTLNKGGVPSQKTDIEAASDEGPEAEPDAGLEDESEGEDDLAADIGKLTGGAPETPETPEPLGRTKKPVAESTINEKWGTKMHTAKKDIGKWEGYTLAELKAKKDKLMKKEKRTAAEQKEVKQLTFAIRAKQKNKWGKIKENHTATHRCEECGSTYETSTPYKTCEEHAGKKAILEVAPPGAKAERFIKKNKEAFIKKYGKEKGPRILYATAWQQFGPKNKSYYSTLKQLGSSKNQLKSLHNEFEQHKKEFATNLSEQKVSDPLNIGHGLIGTNILYRISETKKEINRIKQNLNIIVKEGVIGMLNTINTLNKLRSLEQTKAKTPYGVLYITSSGKNSKKLFETQAERDYWINYQGNNITEVKLIDPGVFDRAIDRKTKG
jgi:hypothetical protein